MKNVQIFQKARAASRRIIKLTDEKINSILMDLADTTETSSQYLLTQNRKDLERMDQSDPKYDRLMLTNDRIKGIANDIRNVATLSSPLGGKLEERTLSNGLLIQKVSVPLGVIGIIYEARPNVTFDVFSLCLKSGNVCVLKGGSDAEFSNKAIVNTIYRVLENHNVDSDIVQLLPTSHEATTELLNAVDFIDIIIPRGSQRLIDYVRNQAKVPVIETGAGIVHTYFDASADINKGKRVITNAKLRRVSVCNALDCLIIHISRLNDLPELTEDLGLQSVEIFADEKAYEVLAGNYPENFLFKAEPEHFGIEFLAKKMAIKTVNSLDEALDHIALYSSKHSEAVIAEDNEVVNRFLKEVDAAAVYQNTSTAFTDGAQFGLGAEIGISTQKLHARGPMALKEMTSYKWIIRGDGQIRQS